MQLMLAQHNRLMKTTLLLLFMLALAGSVSSSLAQPVITQQPQNQTNVLGGNVTFTVTATGTPPLFYQWRYYSTGTLFTNLPGATEPSLTLTNIQPVAGRFAVAVWNAGGTNVSRLTAMTVLLPATILIQPTNLTLLSASHATFSPAVTGAAPVRLQWFFNDTPLPGKTNSSLRILNVQFTNQGAYTLVASNFLRTVTSEVATLTLLLPTNGQNIRLGDDPPALPTNMEAQAETHLARSFTDPNLVVATFQDGRFTDGKALGCGYAVSHDAGRTWSRGLVPGLTALTGGPFERATDPVTAIDYFGNIYIGTYAGHNTDGREAMTLSKSTNGGLSFSAPVLVVTNDSQSYYVDKNWLAVNTFPGTPTFGRVAVSWTQIFLPGELNDNSVRSNAVVVSDDGGLSWSPPRYVSPRRCMSTQPLFLPDGSFVMPYWNFDRSGIEIVVSEDGGTTFSAPRTVAIVQRYDDPIARSTGYIITSAADRMAGVIYVAWQGLLGPTNAGRPSIFFSKSSDKGVTWSNPVTVNDTPNSRSVLIPGIAASPDGQHVSISFYDKRNDPGQGNFVDLYLAESFDGGQTWEQNIRLTDVSSDVRRAPLTSFGYMLGDYQGIVPALDFDTPAIASWVDTRNSTPDAYVIQLARRRGTLFETWQQLRFSTNELADTAISGPEADPDGDGIRNLAEYAHGLEPRHPDVPPLRFDSRRYGLPGDGDSQSHPHIRLWFEALSVLDDVAFSWESSEDLSHWSPAIPSAEQTGEGPSRTLRTLEARHLVNAEEKFKSFRLKVEQTNAPAR